MRIAEQTQVDIDGIKVTPYRAGHVLGACMFYVDIGGLRALYTGDYSRTPDRHLPGADLPPVPPHVVICESTYGVSPHSPREERERRFTDRVHQILNRGGKVLLPVVALGRAQELLLILEDYWVKHPELRGVPIYQASALARRAMTVYQTYINVLNSDMKAAFEEANPFVFNHVNHLSSANGLDDVGPCVVLATPSMLQSGLSRELFEAWCGDANNGVIIADFAVQGTLAREILSDCKSIQSRSGGELPLKMSVDAISFSAHADYPQTQQFLDALAPPHVVLVHGEAGEMGKLKRALEGKAAADGKKMHVYSPKNCQAVEIKHSGSKTAKVLGALAEKCKGHTHEQSLAFIDVHHAISLSAAGRGDEKELLDAMQSYAESHGDDNARVTDAIGLPLARAMVAYREGAYDTVVETLLPIRYHLFKLGGSHAQRARVDEGRRRGRAAPSGRCRPHRPPG